MQRPWRGLCGAIRRKINKKEEGIPGKTKIMFTR